MKPPSSSIASTPLHMSGVALGRRSEGRMHLVGASVAVLPLGLPATAQTITDGDTIKHNGVIYRFWGIDAPESKQSCADGWPAGSLATTQLQALIAGIKAIENAFAEAVGPDAVATLRQIRDKEWDSFSRDGAARPGRLPVHGLLGERRA